jgi:uncharacterized repeat protein (TIGR03803 family)
MPVTHGLRSALLALASIGLTAAPFAQAQQETVLYDFIANSSGSSPYGNLVFDSAGNLYGANSQGGGTGCYGPGCGTVFELSPQPGGEWTETTLHNFNDSTGDGENPLGTVIFDSAGNLYGTTRYGGANSCGIVYQLVPQQNGSWKENILHSFDSSVDGCAPYAGVILDAAGNLYGTASEGGANSWGTAYELSPASGGGWTPKVLHAFGGETDGWTPLGGLIMDAAGNLYGTTEAGGERTVNDGGTVYELHPQAGGAWKERILANFSLDGSFPQEPYASLVFDGSGNLYGTSYFGGRGNRGTVFEVSPNKGGWTTKTLHSFQKIDDLTDGSEPTSSLVLDSSGNIYGTTSDGGGCDQCYGTVFELSPPTSGTEWTEALLYVFTNQSPNGASPQAGVIFDSAGNLYGTAQYGGTNLSGVAYEITP